MRAESSGDCSRCIFWESKRSAKDKPAKGHHGAQFYQPFVGFKDLAEEDASAALGVWYTFLVALAEELVGNLPFAQVLRKRKAQVERGIALVKGEIHPMFFRMPGVSLALAHEWDGATCAAKLPISPPPLAQRRITSDGDEVILIRVNWRDYCNAEFGQEAQQFADKYRPATIPEPAPRTGKGRGKKDEAKSLLDGLTALRLANQYPISLSHDEKTATSVDRFANVRLLRRTRRDAQSGQAEEVTVVQESNFRDKRDVALRFFAGLFSFEDEPEHRRTWAERQRT